MKNLPREGIHSEFRMLAVGVRLTNFSSVLKYRFDYDLDRKTPNRSGDDTVGKTVLFTDLKRRGHKRKPQCHPGGRSEGRVDRTFVLVYGAREESRQGNKPT